MQKFEEDPELGVAGTPFTEHGGYDSAVTALKAKNMSPVGVSFFGENAFEEIGGYVRESAREEWTGSQ